MNYVTIFQFLKTNCKIIVFKLSYFYKGVWVKLSGVLAEKNDCGAF